MELQYEKIIEEVYQNKEGVDNLLDEVFLEGTTHEITTHNNSSRIEITTSDYFTSSEYMPIDVLYYCIYAYFNILVNDSDAYGKAISGNMEYVTYPMKAITDGINTMHQVVEEGLV